MPRSAYTLGQIIGRIRRDLQSKAYAYKGEDLAPPVAMEISVALYSLERAEALLASEVQRNREIKEQAEQALKMNSR